MSKPEKLYCYVDETGQDTMGRLFIVVAVVAGSERQELINFLEEAEKESGGRRKQQWSKKDKKRREKYLDAAFKPQLKGKVFYEIFKDSKEFERLTAETVAHALGLYSEQNKIADYKATIIIDGLNAKAAGRVRKVLLSHEIKIDKIRGERDESSSMLRLADVSARLIRGATQSKWEYRARLQKYTKDGIISELGEA